MRHGVESKEPPALPMQAHAFGREGAGGRFGGSTEISSGAWGIWSVSSRYMCSSASKRSQARHNLAPLGTAARFEATRTFPIAAGFATRGNTLGRSKLP